ncbi:MAG: outer membrane beta-barrel protein [Verrucomicrobiales bacterium]|nr:outer membrane beta-barrel protein [Verrucomicrobiales bacterium]
MRKTALIQVAGTAACLLCSTCLTARAEDADRFRPYLRFHSGDVDPLWNVDDLWSIGVGANFNRYLGGELAFDYFSRDWPQPGAVAEISSFHLVPEVRLRYPVLHDRLVPYVVAGIGPSWMQVKDNKPWNINSRIDVEGMSYTAALGGGIEYFIADNVTFGVEGKYLWVGSIDGTVDGVTMPVDLSAPTFTFGLRVFFDENKPRQFVSYEANPRSRFYFGVRLGGQALTDSAWVPGVELAPEQAAWGGTVSQTGGLLLGADFGRNLGAELSFDHVNHIIDTAALGPVSEYGQGWVLGSLRLRYPTGRWVPYALLGGGICYTEKKDQKLGGVGQTIDTGGMHPAVGVGAGAEYFIVRNFSVNAEVRWGYTWGHDFGVAGVIPTGTGDYSYLAGTIGFRVYLFDL